MEKEKEQKGGGFFQLVFSVLLIIIVINLLMFCFFDSEKRRLSYQSDTIELFSSLKKYQTDLKDKTKFNKELNSLDFNLKSQTYLNRELVSNIRDQGEYVTMTSGSQMLCFAINQLVAGKEIDLRTYKKQYLGVINSQRKGDLGCQEYQEEPWYVIYVKK